MLSWVSCLSQENISLYVVDCTFIASHKPKSQSHRFCMKLHIKYIGARILFACNTKQYAAPCCLHSFRTRYKYVGDRKSTEKSVSHVANTCLRRKCLSHCQFQCNEVLLAHQYNWFLYQHRKILKYIAQYTACYGAYPCSMKLVSLVHWRSW